MSRTETSRFLRIVVVEDDLDVADTFATLLQLDGHDLRVAHNGRRALDVVGEFAPDVAFVDVGLPDIDGYEVATRLRARPSADGIVLIALTGYAADEDTRRARLAGFDHHLSKPVDYAAVGRLLAELTGRAGRRERSRDAVETSELAR